MKKFDLIIIGAGLMGCFCARNISKSPINTLVIEKNDDVCREISKANTAVIYSGLDTKPGTLKTALCVRACKDFETLCSELDVPFNRCGSITVSFGEKSHSVLKEKYAKGIKNGVEGLRLLTKKEVLEMEPYLSPKITGGLFSPATGTVNPWELGIAAYENAKYNGIKFSFCENVTDIHRENDGFLITTDKAIYFSKAVLNCAGLYSDKIHDMVEKPVIKILPDGSDYIVFKKNTPHSPKHIIFQETEKGKGITLVPTVEGNLLVGDTKRPFKEDYATDLDSLNEIHTACREVIPALSMENVIRSFGAARPNCHSITDESKSISGFKILEENGFFSLMGIKTPGLTCANELGSLMAEKICRYLKCNETKPDFFPLRKAIVTVRNMDTEKRNALINQNSDYGKIICICGEITKGEIIEAIKRGASTAESVKRRIGTAMGSCQGSRCSQKITEIIEEYNGKI